MDTKTERPEHPSLWQLFFVILLAGVVFFIFFYFNIRADLKKGKHNLGADRELSQKFHEEIAEAQALKSLGFRQHVQHTRSTKVPLDIPDDYRHPSIIGFAVNELEQRTVVLWLGFTGELRSGEHPGGRISDYDISLLEKFPLLEELSVDALKITESGLAVLKKLPKLKKLELVYLPKQGLGKEALSGLKLNALEISESALDTAALMSTIEPVLDSKLLLLVDGCPNVDHKVLDKLQQDGLIKEYRFNSGTQ